MRPEQITPDALKARAHVGNPRSCWPWMAHRTQADICGTVSRYVGRGCRCDECREAWNAYYRKRWAANAETINARRRERSAARKPAS